MFFKSSVNDGKHAMSGEEKHLDKDKTIPIMLVLSGRHVFYYEIGYTHYYPFYWVHL